MNKLYSVHDHWTDINKKNDVDIESIDGVITGIKVNGEDYGGSEYQNIFDNTINTVLDDGGVYTTTIGIVIEADLIRVTFDGVEYSCPKRNTSGVSTNFYGAPTPAETEESFDWTDFPFSIAAGINGASTLVITQTAGSHTLKIDIPQSGGGESDFSTANVTVEVTGDTNNSKIIFKDLVTIKEDSEGRYIAADANFGVSPKDTPQQFTVILLNGDYGNAINYTGNISVSGNAELLDGFILIHGDCTITIS